MSTYLDIAKALSKAVAETTPTLKGVTSDDVIAGYGVAFGTWLAMSPPKDQATAHEIFDQFMMLALEEASKNPATQSLRTILSGRADKK